MEPIFQKPVLFLFVSALILRLLLANFSLSDPTFSVQQDHYATYAGALQSGSVNSELFPVDDTRLLPGYPVAIYLLSIFTKTDILSGLLISLFSSFIAILIFWMLTRDFFSTVLFSIFPPVWVKQATKVATEPIVTLFLLVSLFAYLRNKFVLSGIILGLACTIRFIAVGLLIAFMIDFISKRNIQGMRRFLIGFFPAFLLLFLYNFFIFGSEGLFHQLGIYPKVGGGTIGVLQIAQDLFRALDWEQYRILISGSVYLMLYVSGLAILFKLRNKSELLRISFYWLLFSLLFIFSIGPVPLLEEFSRFAVPVAPAMVLALSYVMKDELFHKVKVGYNHGQKSQ